MNIPTNPAKPLVAFLLICIVTIPQGLSAQVNKSKLNRQHDWLGRSLLTDDWQIQHPVERGWNLFSVSVVDSLCAWASGWHDSAAGLVVRTTNGGENWSEVTRMLPFNVNDIYFATSALGWVVGGAPSLGQSGYVRRTTDNGQTWTTQITTPNVVLRSVFFLDPGRGWAVGDSGRILATTNSGVSWYVQATRPRMAFGDVVFLPNGTGWCGGTGVLKTTNFGQQWDSVSNILMNKFSFLNDSVGWAITTNGTYAGFNRRTSDGGRTWTEGLRITEVRPTDVTMLSDSLVLSTMWDSRVDPPLSYFPISMRNLTKTLPPIETRASALWGIGFDKTGHGFAVGFDQIVRSADSGRTWTNQVGPLSTSLFSIDMVDDSVGWVVGEKELIMKTTDGGGTWMAQTPAMATNLNALSSVDRYNAFAGGNVFMSTTNGGTTWLKTEHPGNNTITGLSFLDSLRGWAATESNTVFRTTDGGGNWTPQPASSSSVRLHALDFVDSSYGWCTGTSGLIYATTKGGDTWTAQALGGVNLFSSIDFVDRNYGWVAGEHLILRTTNGGAQWINSDSSLHAGYRAVHFVNRDTGWVVGAGDAFVGGQGRIIATTNGGRTWFVQRQGGSSGETGLYSIDAVSSSLVWISGEGDKILHATNGGGITSVQTGGTELPERFELEQNYPNPFNPSTVISYSLPVRAHVILNIYDVLGRKAATLVDGFSEAGNHQAVLNALELSSGVYFYRLQAGEFVETKKLVLLK